MPSKKDESAKKDKTAAEIWSAAVDHQIESLKFWRALQGQPGEELAELEYRQALRKQEKARKKLDKANADK